MNTEARQSVEFLRRINSMKIGGIPIYDFFTYRGYSVWSFIQGGIFTDIRKWQRSGHSPPVVRPAQPLGLFVYRCFFFVVALIATLRDILKPQRCVLLATDNIMGPNHADFRMDKIYTYLVDRHITFQEIIHGVLGKKLRRNFRTRGRLVIYLEVAGGIYWILRQLGRRKRFPELVHEHIEWGACTREEQEFVERFLPKYVKYAEYAVFKMNFFSWLFGVLKPEVFLGIDDPRYYHELVFAARQHHIPSHLLQHGRFDRYNISFMYYGLPAQKCVLPDYYWTWNNHHRKKLTVLSDAFRVFPDVVRVGGKPFDKQIPRFQRPVSGRTRTTVLLLSEYYAPPREIEMFIERILALGTMNIVFSLRTDFPPDSQKRRFHLERFSGREDFRVVAGFTQKDWNAIDVVAGTSSTFLDELIEAGMPAAVLNTSTTTIEDLAEDGLAELVSVDSVGELENIARTEPAILKQRRDILGTTVDINKTLNDIFTSLH